MTRKDYVLIAQAIKDENDNYINAERQVSWTLRSLADRIASVLQKDNPRFDRARFMSACGFD